MKEKRTEGKKQGRTTSIKKMEGKKETGKDKNKNGWNERQVNGRKKGKKEETWE